MAVDEPPGLPGWLKASLVVAGVVVVGSLLWAVFGVGGPHGPGMHRP